MLKYGNENIPRYKEPEGSQGKQDGTQTGYGSQMEAKALLLSHSRPRIIRVSEDSSSNGFKEIPREPEVRTSHKNSGQPKFRRYVQQLKLSFVVVRE